MARSFFTRAALLICLALPAASWARVDVFISIAPPPLPVYVQPPLPDEGYIWSPGYWEYEDGDYYWIPGTWIRPPAVGMFWTPGYWAWSNSGYFFNRGYWGREVGFYGGVNYGYGYNGYGYQGGYWNRGAFYYNRSINNFGNRHFNRTYSKRVENRASFSNISYNGGSGINARPSTRERNYAREKHIAPTAVQTQHVRAAIGNREQRASLNQGRPPVAATDRPGQFQGAAVVPARGVGDPLPDRSRQNDDRRSRDGRPDSPQASSRISTSQINPAREDGSQPRPQRDRLQDQSRPPQQRDEQVRQQRDQSQREVQQFQQQREQQGQQREQIQREQQIQQQRERQTQQDQQGQQRERSQQAQQQREQQRERQVQPRQEPSQSQAPQRSFQTNEQQRPPEAREQRRAPQGEPRRERGRD